MKPSAHPHLDAVRFETLAKPGGGSRVLSLLGPAGSASYAALVRPLTPRIEASLTPGVIANRAGPRGSLRPPGPRRRVWRSAIAGAVSPRPQHVVISDVADFYASIREPALRLAFGRAGARNGDSARLAAFLRAMWDAGVVGLPVGPEPSAILANAVLAHADDAARAAGARVIRWVDDVVLVADDAATARRALMAWAAGLDQLGLVVNEGKTRLAGPGLAREVLLGTSPSRTMR